MLPDLLAYAPIVTAKFHLSQPLDLITSLFLLKIVDAFEGLSEWVYQTEAALPDDLRSGLSLLGYPIRWCFRGQDSLIWRLPLDHPAHNDIKAFLTHLEGIPAEEYQRVLILNLALHAGEPAPQSLPDDTMLRQLLTTARWFEQERWERAIAELWDDEQLVALAQMPQDFKERIIDLLTRFWEEFYSHDFESHREAMARSITYHRKQIYPRNFTDLFRQVTGRTAPSSVRDYVREHLEQIEQVIFCPCAHLGLYFQLTPCIPFLVVAFNYRTTPTHETEGTTIVELFPPLKALADESRLHILSLLQEREMYAQEIVEAVGLSQSTVSRHLQLLERTEVITSRQVRRTKFYAINKDQGRKIIEALEHLMG